MAHYPRWIGDTTLDSQAMLAAFLEWAGAAPVEEMTIAVRHLWIVEHYPRDTAPVTIRGIQMQTRPCQASPCTRCSTGKGGYQFRWADRRWLATYEEMRRPGSLDFSLI